MDPIWLTNDGRYAVSLPGDTTWPCYPSFESAQRYYMGARSLGNFLNLPIAGKELSDWQRMDGEMRRKHAASESAQKENEPK